MLLHAPMTLWRKPPPQAHPGRQYRLSCTSSAAVPRQTSHTIPPNSSAPADSGTVVYFRSDWPSATLHASLHGGAWQDIPMQQETLANLRWHLVHLPATAASNGVPAAEFVLTDGQNKWDKPAGGGNYVVREQGIPYRVQGGSIAPVRGKRVMVVSDLDDTLIGNDDATLAFTQYWQQEACLLGGKLVYNTGRALDKFLTLLQEKHWCMAGICIAAEPDCLISSVGTRIYVKQENGAWGEDAAYAQFLDRDWDLAAMREGAYKALAAVGNDVMHFRPADEQNDHKITVGVQVDVLDRVLDMLRDAQAQQSIKATLVSSGKGDWRFLDIISPQAGKLAALEYVRKRYGFKVEETVACGDSGNDIDMLAGKNLAIVVGNAQPDLVRWMDGLTDEQRRSADGQVRLYHSQSNMAAGILEGLQHFGFR